MEMNGTKPKAGRPANVEVECVWPNVWTSKGQMFKGDTMSLSPKEAESLIEQGSCK